MLSNGENRKKFMVEITESVKRCCHTLKT